MVDVSRRTFLQIAAALAASACGDAADPDATPIVEVPIRGRVEPLIVRTARTAAMLATRADVPA
jgi:hypothetical protein